MKYVYLIVMYFSISISLTVLAVKKFILILNFDFQNLTSLQNLTFLKMNLMKQIANIVF